MSDTETPDISESAVNAMVIHEYVEEMPVVIKRLNPELAEYCDLERSKIGYLEGRWIIAAKNEGGHNGTDVDLLDVLRFVKAKMPSVWASV